jgi:predicted transcriptional regulator
MSNVINDYNPKSADLQEREDALNNAFQQLKDAIRDYTNTQEHGERKHGVVNYLSALASIENELRSMKEQTTAHRNKIAEQNNQKDYLSK